MADALTDASPYLAASVAAKRDLAPVFADEWRMALADATRQALAAVDWKAPGLTATRILEKTQPIWK